MTDTLDASTGSQTGGGTGRVVRVIGPVVDVEFAPEEMPEIHNALTVERTLGEDTLMLTLEVEQHVGDNMVRAISMQPTDGLVRGTAVQDTGSPIMVPVGDATHGHIFHALRKPLDVKEVQADTYWPIHRQSPPYDQLEAKTE